MLEVLSPVREEARNERTNEWTNQPANQQTELLLYRHRKIGYLLFCMVSAKKRQASQIM